MTRFLNRRRAGPPVVIRRSTGTTGRFARLRFEELEPRILLSADLAPGLSLPFGQEEVGVLPLGDSLHLHVERQVSQYDASCDAASIADLYVVQPGEADALERAESLARATCGSPALVVELDASRDGFEQLEEITGSLAALERMTVIVPSSPDGFAFGDATWQPEEFASRIEGVAVQCGAVIDLVASGDVDATASTQRLELVFVDSRVADADSLVADLLLQSDASVRYEVVTIDSGADGLAQVGVALQGRHDVAALHLISHGADGGILLGAGFVDAGALRGAAPAVGAWAGALTADADILVYGCDVASGGRGREFADLLAGLTGADVASSDDTTAADLLGGDWQLEYEVGEVQAAVVLSKTMQQAWAGKLALDALGTEVAVNTQTTGTQSAAGSGPGAVAMDDAGNYVVVFEDADSNGGDVFFRRFDAAGNPLGAATRVNATLADRQYDARVAMAGNGSFVVTWTSNLQDGSGTGIHAQRFAADGTAQGGEFRVNTTTTGDQGNSTVAMASGGAFVVGWVSDDGSGTGIRGQRYDAAGVAQGGELLVNVTTTQVQSAPSATITDSGDFGFVWQGLQSGSYDVYLRGYSAAGAAGAETRVNQTTVGAQTSVVIGTDATGANVVIAWASGDQDPDGSQGIYARRFNGSGVAQGGEFRVNSSTSGTQSAPVVAVDSDGDFVVGWNDAALDGSGSSVWLQRFDSAGLRIGGEVRANTTTAGDQLIAGVAISGSHVAVAWEGSGGGDAAGVFTRAFTAVQYTTVTVSTTADTIDGSNTSSIAALLASRGTDGQVSLREAITAANNTTGPVRILFDVPAATVGGVHTITLDSLLPPVTNRVLIDGTTEPDHGTQPMIVLRAQTGITVENGLRLWSGSDGSEIRGFVFQGFSAGGVEIGDSDGNTIAGNWFGLDATGNAGAANGWGITLWNSANNVIGGTTAADRNVISGGTSSGIALTSDDGSTTGNRIIGNYIGTNAAGTAAVGNGGQGIYVDWATGSSIGGTGAGEGNVISGTTSWVGIQLTALAASNTIQGNYIGLDAAGASVIANAWGGIYAQSSGNVIGGSAAGAANVISGSGGFGITLDGAGATGNVVTGNRIGTDATGTLVRGNGGAGVVLSNGAANNRIGGTQAGEGNWIANGGGDGIELSAAGTGNALLGNLVWDNGGLAIDLLGGDGVTANDAGDADTGSNALQNYPVLGSAIVAGGATTITGSIDSTANTTLRLEFYSSPTADASGHGEAAVFLGATTVTTDAGGNASFSTTLFGVGVTAGHAVSATATVSLGGGNYGSTSEFAANVVAAPLQAPVVGVLGAQSTPEDVARIFSVASGNAITITDADADADAASGTVEVALSVTQGVLTLAGTSGLAFVTGDGSADATLVFRGTTADVNAALDGLVYAPPAEFSGASTLTVTARDALVVGLERDADLAGRYTFEGSAADVAPGTAQDGTLVGNATYVPVVGRGQVLSLDGDGDAVQVAGVVGTANVTIGGWVNLSALSVGRTEFISLDNRVHIALDDYAGVKGSVQTGVGQWLDLSSNQFVAGTGWHHVMYVYDDVNDAHALYIDGQLAASSSTTASIDWSGAATTWIGRHPTNTPGWDLEGEVDDVRIYGRALSAAEVATIASGQTLQDTETVALTVTVVNDAPVLGFASGSFTYPENAGAVVMAPGATVSDVDSPDFAGGSLVVTLSANGQAEDRLGIRNEGNGAGQVGISGNVVSYGGVAIGSFSGGGDGSTPLVVSFNASASVAAVQAVGRNITYQNVSDAPSTLTRTVEGYVTDGDGGTSNLVSGAISIQSSNDAPVVTTTGGSLSYNENAGAMAVDPGLTLADVDSTSLTGATVRISVAYAASEDLLGFSAQSGITASWDGTSGTLTLSGTATVAQYQAALRSITYTNGSENPSIAVRTVSFTVSDGVAASAVATRQVQVVNWQDAPTTINSGASAAEDVASVAVVLAGADVDGSIASFTLAGLPANGTLYADAGRTQLVSANTPYSATGNQRILYFVPNANWNGVTTFQYFATDDLGMADVTPATAAIVITPVNDAPTFGGLDGTPAYTEDGAAVKLDVDVTLADVELSSAGNYAGATLTLARSGSADAQDQLAFDGTVVTTTGAGVFVGGVQVGTYTFTGGQLSVSFGSGATQARVDALLRNIVYWNSSDTPPASVALGWTFSDGNAGSQGSGGTLQATGTTTVTITAVDDAPVATGDTISGNEDVTYIFTWTEFGVTDADTTIDGATAIQVTALPADGSLQVSNGSSWEPVTVGQAVTRASIDAGWLRFVPDPDEWGDDSAATAGVGNGRTDYAVFRFVPVHTIAILSPDAELGITYAEDTGTLLGAPWVVSGSVYVSNLAESTYPGDHDQSFNLRTGASMAQVLSTTFSSGLEYELSVDVGWHPAWQSPEFRLELWAGATRLGFVDQSTITPVNGAFVRASLMVDGSAFAALDGQVLEVRLVEASGWNALSADNFLLTAVPGGIGAEASVTIDLAPSNDAPVVATTGTVLSYTENDGPRAVYAGLTVGDVDSATLAGATASITTNYANGQDVLGFVDAGGITGAWDPATGTLTLSGTATVAQYQAALRSVTYANTSENPGTLARTVAFTVTDGTSTSAAAARQVQLAAVNDAPTLGYAGLPGPVDFTEQSPVGIAPAITVDDVDSAQLAGAVVTFVAGYEPGVDQLAFTDMLGITGSWNAATGTLTLSGTASVASYQAALRSIAFYNGSDAPSTTPRSIEIVVSDGATTSNVLSRTVTVTLVDDLPTAQAGGPYTIAEGGTLQLDASASVDPDGGSLTYAWDLDGDGVYGEAGEPLTVTPAVSWSTLQGAGIVDDGVHVINLRVTDAAGVSAYSKAVLTVANAAPTLVVSGTGSASAGQSYTLNLAATDAGADTISSWTVNWGDGTIVTYAGNPSSVTHTYGSVGNFGVLVAATDEDGTHLQNSLLVPTWAGSDAVFRIAPGGAVLGQFGAASGLDDQAELVVGPDGNVYVTSMSTGAVKRFAADGTFLGDFIAANPTLGTPAGLGFGPEGNLYVVSYDHASVLRYDGTTGALLGSFVTAGSGGLSQPLGIAFGPDGDLYVTSRGPDAIMRYDGTTGAFVGVFVAPGVNGPNSPEDITFGPDGNLYVANLGDSTVRRYDGATGAWLGDFVTAGSGGLSGPAGLAFGPDGHLYVGSQNTDSIKRYDGATGAFLGDYVAPAAGGLDSPAYFNFLPQHRVSVAAAQPPVATPSGATATFTENGSAIALDPALTVTDADNTTLVGATLRIATNYASGQDTLAFVAQGGITGAWDATSGTLTLSGSASLATYQQALRSITFATSGESPSTATRGIELALDDGIVAGPVANLAVNVAAVNDAPTTTPVTLAPLAEDGGARLITQAQLLANAADVDGGALVAGNLQLASGAGSLVDNGNGTWTYTPAANDDTAATFSNTIADGNGGSVAGSASLDLMPVNDVPVTTPVTLAPLAEDGGPRLITQSDLLANATDVDGDALLASNLQLASGAGSLVDNGNGTWTYTPAANDDTAASFSYTISDGAGASTAGSAALDLTSVNDAPTSTPVTLAPHAEDGGPRLITQAELLATATDIDGAALRATNLQLASGAGTLVDNGDGSWTYTPAANDDSAASFSYSVVDGAGGSVAASAALDLLPVNDAPTITSDGGGANATLQRSENASAVTVSTASDVEADAIRYSIVGGIDAARFQSDSVSGTLVFVAAPDFEAPADADGDGVYEVLVQADDGHGGLTTQALRIVVGDVNEAPAAVADALGAVAGQPTMIASTALLANDTDIDGDSLRLAAVSAPGFGTVSQDPAGNWVYAPMVGFAGVDRFTYTVADAAGLEATAEVTVVVVAADGGMTDAGLTGVGSTTAAPAVTAGASTAVGTATGGADASATIATSGTSTAGSGASPTSDHAGTTDSGSGGELAGDTTATATTTPDLAATPAAAEPAALLAPLFDPAAIFGPPAGGLMPVAGDAGDAAAPTGFDRDQRAAARALETRQWAPPIALAKDAVDALLTEGAQQAFGLFRSLSIGAASDDVGRSLHVFRDLLDEIDAANSTTNREVAEVVVGSGLALSAGAVAWLLRAGALGASLLSVLPAWSTFDPIPVISRRRLRRSDDPPAPADLAAEAALGRVLRPGLQHANPDAS